MTKRCKNCGWLNDDSCANCQKCNAPLDNAPTVPSSYRETAYESGVGQRPATPLGSESMRNTVSENQFFGSALYGGQNIEFSQQENDNDSIDRDCPNCGYCLREGVEICPNCGSHVNNQTLSEKKNQKCPHCGNMNPNQAVYCNHCGKVLDAKIVSMNSSGNSGKVERKATVNPWAQPGSGDFCTLRPIAWEGENVNHQPLSFSGSVIGLNRANTDPNNQSITSSLQAELSCEDGEWYVVDKSAMHTTYVRASRKMKLNKGDILVLGNRLFEFNYNI